MSLVVHHYDYTGTMIDRQATNLNKTKFDVLIIGAGIYGAAVARDPPPGQKQHADRLQPSEISILGDAGRTYHQTVPR